MGLVSCIEQDRFATVSRKCGTTHLSLKQDTGGGYHRTPASPLYINKKSNFLTANCLYRIHWTTDLMQN